MALITIRPTPTGYSATFHDNPMMVAIMGTDTIPTPYTPKAPAALVVAEVAARNPRDTVVFEPRQETHQ